MRNNSARFAPLVGAVACAVAASTSHAAPSATPIYQQTFLDAVTGDLASTRVTGAGSPAFVSQGNGGQYSTPGGATVQWDVDQFQPNSLVDRADDYVAERYERPTDQTFEVLNSATGERRFAASKYYQYIDIVSAKAGFDSDWLYVQIDLFGERVVNNGDTAVNGAGIATGSFVGLADGTRYGFRIGKGPANAPSRNGFLVSSEEPSNGKVGLGTFGVNVSTEVLADQNDAQGLPGSGDVGGVSIAPVVGSTKEGLPGEVSGDGYDVQVAADGRTNGNGGFLSNQDVLYTRRLVDSTPENGSVTDNSIIEFALDYKFFGFTEADLLSPNFFLMMFTTKGLTAPANIFWNDEYNYNEAGTPNSDQRGVAGPNSAFPTNGTQNIYQLDTIRGGAVPEPSTGLLAAAAVAASFRRRPRR